MYCGNCGHDNPAQNITCAACGAPLTGSNSAPPPPPAPGYGAPPPAYGAPAYNGPAPPNHMVFSIITTALSTIATILGCCCLPLGLIGIVAIVQANKVDKLVAVGDIAGAQAASASAKLWAWITTGLGIFAVVMIILSLVLNMMGVMDDNFMEELRKQMEAQQG